MRNTLPLLILSLFISGSAQEKTSSTVQLQPKLENNQNAQTLPVIEFIGSKAVSAEILKKRADECLVKSARYIKENSSGVMAQCIREAQKLVWGKGYIQAKFSQPQIQPTAAGTKALVTIDDGIAYRLGDITFDGLKVFPAEKILSLSKIKKGDIGNFERLNEWTEAIAEIYRERGYHLFDAEPVPEFRAPLPNQTEGTVEIKLIIDEGQQFYVNRIDFTGNTSNVRDQKLRNAMIIDQGDIFNDKLLKASIDKLNQLKLFEPIDYDRDVKIRTDEETPRVDIQIKVKEKAKPQVNLKYLTV